MNFLKTVAAVSAIALSSFSANAEVVSVGGITWNSDYVNPSNSTRDDFFSSSSYTEGFDLNVDTGIAALSATGIIDGINLTDANTFCVVPGCMLTYSFEGFTVDTTNANAVDSSAGKLEFTVTEANGDENLWLSLVASVDEDAFFTGFAGTGLSAFTAFFDVESLAGTAWENFDTDSQQGGTDFEFIGTGFGLDTGVFKSNSVPAPTSLAVFGLGLLGLAAARRRKA